MSSGHGASREADEFGKEHGLVHEVIVTGRKVGARKEFWSALAHDESLFRAVVDFWNSRGKTSQAVSVAVPTAPKRAKDIMGENFIGLEEVEKHLDIAFSKKDAEKLAEIPWSEETLEEVKHTHILVPGYPLSILQIREKVPQGIFLSYKDAWYNNQPFATEEKVEMGWYLIRKGIQPTSTGKTYQEQLALLSKDEENPKAVEMVYAKTLFWLTRKEKFLTDCWARCRDLGSDGYHANVGLCDGGLSFRYYWDGDRR